VTRPRFSLLPYELRCEIVLSLVAATRRRRREPVILLTLDEMAKYAELMLRAERASRR
jgi:hypothetical protein